LVSVLEKLSIYVVGDVGVERITLRRSGVQRVVMEKQPLLGNIHGGPRISIEKEFDETVFVIIVWIGSNLYRF